jgi:3-phenylpropionate/trans-cinnamate dioxygenase ferredoxin subunit
MMKIKLAEKSQVEPGKVILVDGKYDSYGVYQYNGRYLAFLDNCPHADAPLGADCLHGDEIVCPVHGACFTADNGQVKTPPAQSDLVIYETTEEDGWLYIEVED